MEQTPENENKKAEQKEGSFHLDLSGLTPKERRETFMKLLGLPENATEADMAALVDKEHKEFDKNRGEFNLEDFKKKEGPVIKGESEEEQLEKLAGTLSFMPKNAVEGTPRSGFPEVRLEHSPTQVMGAENLIKGKKYSLHYTNGYSEDFIIAVPPYLSGAGYSVKVRNSKNGEIQERSCQDMGVAPYKDADGRKTWNPSAWVEPVIEAGMNEERKFESD